MGDWREAAALTSVTTSQSQCEDVDV